MNMFSSVRRLNYDSELLCCVCRMRGLLYYVMCKRCERTVCIFCYKEKKHVCSRNDCCVML